MSQKLLLNDFFGSLVLNLNPSAVVTIGFLAQKRVSEALGELKGMQLTELSEAACSLMFKLPTLPELSLHAFSTASVQHAVQVPSLHARCSQLLVVTGFLLQAVLDCSLCLPWVQTGEENVLYCVPTVT